MSDETLSIRNRVRQLFNYRCCYCGTDEISAGGELEIEHFRPKSKGGTDAIDNLVYSCSRCNLFKSAYWPKPNAPSSQHLLHPRHDNLQEHIDLTDHGELIGLTPRGWFHISWLHLNRPQLIEARRKRLQLVAERRQLARYEHLIAQLQQQLLEASRESARLRSIIEQLRSE